MSIYVGFSENHKGKIINTPDIEINYYFDIVCEQKKCENELSC